MIGFVGLSHLGLVSSIATAAKGHQVVGYDPDAALCARLQDQQLPLYEPGLPELLREHRNRIRFSADPASLASCAVIYIARDVPTDPDNRSDLSVLRPLIETVAAHASPGAILVILCQVPPGFTRQLAGTLPGPARPLYYQVETLIFGRAVERALYPERLIIGCADPQAALPEPYARLLQAFDCPILPMRYESAELTKISINLCLVASVSVANTLAELCEAIGADWAEIVPTLKLDRRIGPHAYLSPGLGIAGGNLERDLVTVSTLAARHGTDAGIVRAWLDHSRYRRDWLLRTLHDEVYSRQRQPVVAVWGLAYKPDTTSTKNSPALALLEALPPGPVRVYDPQVRLNPGAFPGMLQVASALEACERADVLAIATPWQEFAAIPPGRIAERMAGRVLLDPYGILDRQQCRAAGFAYHRLGTPLAA
jgi:UDPglucose 6-dehydrogenase